MPKPCDIVVTWPKSRTLQSYLKELTCAAGEGKVINYRVASPPTTTPERCYIVHEGCVRGYNLVKEIAYRDGQTVEDVVTGKYWKEGWYVVRDPRFFMCATYPMTGFRGWRWFDRMLVGQ